MYYAVIVFLLASVTDKLDGYIVRKYNQTTNLGKLLDPLADKLLISAALILMVSQQKIFAWVALVIIAREVIVTGIMLDNRPFSFFTILPIDQMLLYIAVIITVYSGYNYIKNNYHSLKLDSRHS